MLFFFSTPFHFLFPFSFFFSMSAVKANHTGRFSRGRRRKIRKKEPNRIPTLLTFISPERIFFFLLLVFRFDPADNGLLESPHPPESNFKTVGFGEKWKMKKNWTNRFSSEEIYLLHRGRRSFLQIVVFVSIEANRFMYNFTFHQKVSFLISVL